MADIVSFHSRSANVNVATYYFKHESDDDIIGNMSADESISEACSDSEDISFELSLNYSKEDVHALAIEAEKMVLNKTTCENYTKGSNATWQADTKHDSSDSDYESKASRECFISSEPNIFQRRLSPQRKLLNSRRKDWRKSLPECLEYFSPISQNYQTDLAQCSPLPELFLRSSSTDEVAHRQADSVSRNSQASTGQPAYLWEQEQYLSEVSYQECQDHNNLESTLNFGEDYEMCLQQGSNSDSSGSEFSLQNTKQWILKSKKTIRILKETFTINNSEKDIEMKKSKSILEKLLNKITSNAKTFGYQQELENALEICKVQLSLLSKKRNKMKVKCSRNNVNCLIKQWDKLRVDIQEMLHQCLEFSNICENIDEVKDNLMKIGQAVDTADAIVEDAEIMLEKCKTFHAQLFHLADDLFQLNLTVHDLLCQVSKTGHKQNISLVYQCKQEVILLYTLWQDVRQTVTQADRKYQKLRYVEEEHKCIEDASDNKEISKDRYSDNSRDSADLLQDKLARLQKMLEDLKYNIVTNNTNTKIVTAAAKENPTKDIIKFTKAPTLPAKWIHLTPKSALLSLIVIISILSISLWPFSPSWQIWPKFGYSNGPPPI